MAIINKGMSRRSFLGLTGSVAAVAGLGLTGCGGSSSDEGSASGSTDSANRGGGVITAGSAYAPSSFDPASTGSAVGLGANWHVVEGLYGIDYHDYSTFNVFFYNALYRNICVFSCLEKAWQYTRNTNHTVFKMAIFFLIFHIL